MEEEHGFSQLQLDRYSRQIRLEGFGLRAQRRLRASHVAISRGGGVGGTIALHLARAGIGRLTIAHGGVLVPEYLNRMPLILNSDLGRPCVDAFAEMLGRVNPDVDVRVVGQYVNDANVQDVVGGADLIADGAPLFEERYTLNRAAVAAKVPLISGAMYDTEGYVTTILPGVTPCLACIYPTRPDYWNDVGVFPAIGPGPTIVGAMAAMEAIKVLTGFGEPLSSRLWFFDLRTNTNRLLKVERNLECPVCGHL